MEVNVMKIENILMKIGYILKENYIGNKLVFAKEEEREATIEMSSIVIYYGDSIKFGTRTPTLASIHKVHVVLTKPERTFIDYLSNDFTMQEITSLSDVLRELSREISDNTKEE